MQNIFSHLLFHILKTMIQPHCSRLKFHKQIQQHTENRKECNRNHPRQLKRRISRSVDNQYRCQRGEQDKQPVSINYMLLQSAEHNKKNPQLQKQQQKDDSGSPKQNPANATLSFFYYCLSRFRFPNSLNFSHYMHLILSVPLWYLLSFFTFSFVLFSIVTVHSTQSASESQCSKLILPLPSS